MLTNREKKLLYLLAVIIVVFVCGLFFFFRYNDLVQIEDSIDQTTLNIQRILTNTPDEEALQNAIEELNGRIEEEKNKYYFPGEIDLSALLDKVTDLMRENNITVIKSNNESNPNSKYVQFQVEGSAYNLARVLRRISDNEKYWSILDLSIDNKRQNGVRNGKTIAATMRIIYETNSNNDN